MATLDSNGVLIYQDTDNYTPIQTALNLAQSNLSSILGANAQIVKVSSVGDRNAKATARGSISKANPFVAWRADAADGLQLEYTTNGTAWRTIADKEYYGGVVDEQVLLSGGASIILRRIPGRVVTITANTGTWVDSGGNNVVNFEGGAALVPEPFRPPRDVYGSGVAGDGGSLYIVIGMTVRSTGAILLTKPTNAISGMAASVTYVY